MSAALLAVLALGATLGVVYLAARFGYNLGKEDAERENRALQEKQDQCDEMARRRVVALREARELLRKERNAE